MNKDTLIDLRSNVQKFVRIFGLLEQNVTPCGYPLSVSQTYALQELESRGMSVTELALRLNLERSSVSRLVDALVKENFIERDINKANRREMELSLTDKGSRTIRQIREQSIKFYEGVLKDLSVNDQKIIIEGIKTFTDALLKYKEKEK